MMWPLMWLNRNIATINVTLQFLYIYITTIKNRTKFSYFNLRLQPYLIYFYWM